MGTLLPPKCGLRHRFYKRNGDNMKYRDLKISFEIDGASFSTISIGKDWLYGPIPRHSHSKNSYEMHYISQGQGTLIADKEKYDLSPGLFYMTGPGIDHEQISNPDDPMEEYGIYLQIDVEKKLPSDSPVKLFLSKPFWIGPIGEDCSRLMDTILLEIEEKPFGYEQMLPALLKQLTLLIIRKYKKKAPLKVKAVTQTISPEDLMYLTIEEAFLYNYKDISLQMLSQTINTGLRQTERILKNHYGKTFLEMKTHARMSAAGLLLWETSDSIAEISEKLGYSSSEHFTNAFKKFYGQSPREYRKNS